MQKPHYIDETLITIPPEKGDSKNRTPFLINDFEKTFFKELTEKDIDILLMDNYFEVRFGVGLFDNILITNNE